MKDKINSSNSLKADITLELGLLKGGSGGLLLKPFGVHMLF